MAELEQRNGVTGMVKLPRASMQRKAMHVMCLHPEERQFGAWIPGMSKRQGRDELERARSARRLVGEVEVEVEVER